MSFGRKICCKIVKTAVSIPWGTIWEKTFVWKFLSYHECSSGFGWKFFGRIAKTPVHNFRRTFFSETFVWKSFRFKIFLRISGANCSAGLSKLHYIFSDEFLRRKFLYEKNFRFIEFSPAVVGKVSAGLWILHSIFPKEHFGWKFLFWKKI